LHHPSAASEIALNFRVSTALSRDARALSQNGQNKVLKEQQRISKYFTRSEVAKNKDLTAAGSRGLVNCAAVGAIAFWARG